MYSKEEAKELKREFWTTFSQEYPRKWFLHNTKIKDFSFKFYLDNRRIEVLLAIENKDLELRKIYFQKIESLKTILKDEFLPDILFDEHFVLDNGKEISKIWVEKDDISFHNKNNWEEIYSFYYEKMDAFERFFYEYEDYIKDLETNV